MMRLICLTEDDVLCGKLKNNQVFENVIMINCISDLKQAFNCDVMVVSDRIVPCELIADLKENFPNAIMFYMVSNSSDYKMFQKIETICHAHDIHIVYPKQTQDQIISFIIGVIKPREDVQKNHVTAFVGAQSRVGVTTTVMAVATRLGILTDAKIGVLGLNSWNPGTVFIREYEGSYLDELKTLLSNNMLSSSQLLKEMFEHNHFFYLAGNRDIKKRLHYSIKEIYYLIEQAKKIYDLTLIDAGCNFDDALCIQSLLNSDSKFLVTNQQMSCMIAWQTAYEQVLEPMGISKQDFLMIINQYKQKPQLPDAKQLAHDHGIPCLRHITDMGDLSLATETHQKLIIDFDEPDYIKDIDFIVRALIKTYKLNMKTQTKLKRTGFIQRLFG